MKKHLLILGMSSLFLWACHQKNTTSNSEAENSLSDESLAEEIQENTNLEFKVLNAIKLTNKRCHNIQSKQYCDQIKIMAPTFKNKILNNYVYLTLTGSENELKGSLKKALDSYSKQELNYLTERYNEDNAKNQLAQPYQYEEVVDFKLVHSTDQLAFFKHINFIQDGGAHPDTVVYNLVVNSSLNDIILDDLLLSDSKQKLLELQKEAISQILRTKEATPEYIQEVTATLKLGKNWGFDKENILFSYSPYEVAAYSYGIIDIAIPKEKLVNIIKPEYLELIFEKDTENKENK